MRGLKLSPAADRLLAIPVAPLAGAWIETLVNYLICGWDKVAPLAGAWIETPARKTETSSCGVAPLAGAWIETSI